MSTPNPIPADPPLPTVDPNASSTDPGSGAALPEGGIPEPPPTTPQSAAPEPEPSPLGIEGELASDPRLSKFQDVSGLAKSYLELESAAGNAIRIPGEAAGEADRQDFLNKLQKAAPELMVRPDKDNPEQMEQFYQTLGRPARADMYELPELQTPDGEKADTQGAEAFRDIAFKANLTEDQFKNVLQGISETNNAAENQALENWGKSITEVKKEWGQTYPDRYRRAASFAVKTKAPQEVINLLQEGFISAETLRWLDGLANAYTGGETELTSQPDGDTQTGETPAEARARISEMMNNREHPIWDQHHPDHARAVQERLRLEKAANPDASTNINDLRTGGHSAEFDS